MEKILYSSRIKKLFEKYASLTDKSGEKVMTMDDFVRSCHDTSVIDVIKYSQLRSLYRIIRGYASTWHVCTRTRRGERRTIKGLTHRRPTI